MERKRQPSTEAPLPNGEKKEPLVRWLYVVIRFSVRLTAVLMTLVIIWSVADVAWVLYHRVMEPPIGLLDLEDILMTFSAFLVILIAIEIFINIVLYLREDVIHVKLVMATALMAIARKIIAFDYAIVEPDYIWATAGIVFALSIGYWLVPKKIYPNQGE
jgi:uncharacterized membrane protein (DUF373 family)